MSAIFEVNVPYSGYIRGIKVVTVTANSQEEAIERAKESDYDDVIDTVVYRDDTDCAWEDSYI